MTTKDINESLSVKDIFNQNPKARLRLWRWIDKQPQLIALCETVRKGFDGLPLEAQIGYLLSWMRSEGYTGLSCCFVEDGSYAFLINDTNGDLETLKSNGKDFNTAFLALLFEFCKQLENESTK